MPEKKKKSTISLKEHEKVKKYLHEEILKRDKIIDGLKEENKILIRTSLKRAEELKDLQDKVERKLKLSPKEK